VESTVLDLSGDAPTILRPGAISLDMLRPILGHVEQRSGNAPPTGALPSPGLLERHYSPRAPLTVYEGSDAVAHLIRDACAAIAQGQRVGIMAAEEDRPALTSVERLAPQPTIVMLGPERDLDTIASRLYAALRELDASGVDRILARGFPGDEGLAIAIRDRLRRASARA
jgi:L-threonylcarbamoyladenylate synthase